MGLTEHGKATYNTYWAPLGDCSFLTATTISRISQFLLNFIGNYWKAIIWTNKEITVENKPVYYKHYVNTRVICIQDLNSTDSYNQLSKKICKTNILEWTGLRRSFPLSLRRHDRYPSINSPTFVVGDNILRKEIERITTPYLSEKKLNRPILFMGYRVTFILTATIWNKYLSCHTLSLSNRVLRPPRSSTK